MNIAVVPFSDEYLNNKLFDINDEVLNRDNLIRPYYEMKEMFCHKGIEINTIDYYENLNQVDYIFFFGLNYKEMIRCLLLGLENKMIYFAWEPEVVVEEHSCENLKRLKKYFKYILTWNDDLIDNEEFIKIYIPYYYENVNLNKIEFEEKKLLVNISGNKCSKNEKELYSERLKVIKFFEDNLSDSFDLYGVGWNKEGFKNYKGKVNDKTETYQKYKFALSLENMKDTKGYITEKILDCFKAEIVPIYSGPSNINDYIPSETFIDYSNFNSVEELVIYLEELSEEQYNNYIYNIKKYKNSNEFNMFSTKVFLEIISGLIEKDKNSKKYKTLKIDKVKFYISSTMKKLKKVINKNGAWKQR